MKRALKIVGLLIVVLVVLVAVAVAAAFVGRQAITDGFETNGIRIFADGIVELAERTPQCFRAEIVANRQAVVDVKFKDQPTTLWTLRAPNQRWIPERFLGSEKGSPVNA